MIIMGIDPGIATTGFGIINLNGTGIKMLDYGVIRTRADEKKEIRLALIHSKISQLIEKYKPDVFAIEKLFFNRNTKTALQVGEARGVALLAAGQAEVEVFEYTPLQIKECLTGYGRSKKKVLREIVQVDLGLLDPPRPIDASDALAVALCHHYLTDL